MKCDKCGEELDFFKMRTNNIIETGEVGLPIYLVVEYWNEQKGNYKYSRRELRSIEVDEDFADKRVDYLNHIYEDKYPPNERPLVNKEKNYLCHFFAVSMDNVARRPVDSKLDMIEMVSDRKWNEQIGEIVEATYPLTDEVVAKLLLKYGEKVRKFYLQEFIEAFNVDEEQALNVLRYKLMPTVMRFVIQEP